MSYGVMAYSVDIDQLTATIGSGDDGKRRAICGRFKKSITGERGAHEPQAAPGRSAARDLASHSGLRRTEAA